MKFLYRSLYLLLLLSATATAQKFTTDDPTAYNNYIVEQQKLVMDKIVDYTIESVHGEDSRKLTAMKDVVVKQLDLSVGKLQNMETLKGDFKFKNDAIEVFEAMKKNLTEDYTQISVLKKDMKSSFEAMEKLFEAEDKQEQKMTRLNEKFTEAQKEFAKKNGVTLQFETKEDNIISTINDVNKYSRQVLLEYFRASKPSGLFLEELNSKKASTDKLETYRQDLITACTASLAKLNTLPAYKDEDFYKSKVAEGLEQQKKLAENDYPDLIKFLQIQSKKPSNNTEVDEYNKGVKRFNEVIVKMNQVNARSVNGFNNGQSAFLKKYIPKKKK